MRNVHYKVRAGILGIVDFFYPLFRKFLPHQTYRYAACGGSNTIIGLFIYFFSYNFILLKHNLSLGFITFKPHIAALFISFLFTFPVGFYLSMYVVFHGSYLKKRVQLFRYFLVVLGCMFINYLCLKLFVEVFNWYATPSQMLTTCIVVLFSYFSQRYFSFRSEKVENAAIDNFSN
ncbi:MAG: GtrA family protein [Flavisolibacter sp.]